MAKLLVITESYPSHKNIYNMGFVHSRNIEYLKLGVSVDVLSFSAEENYTFEGIEVLKRNSINIRDLAQYDCVVSHAPNIRNHILFLWQSFKYIRKVAFIFHGHEALKINDYYPRIYPWERKNIIKNWSQDLYDYFKLKIMRLSINHFSHKLKLIFVSNWMKDNALKCLGSINTDKIYIINNPINQAFVNQNFNADCAKKGDFITIRPLDNSKYGIDLVVALAENNPQYTFTIYGKGQYFQHLPKPKNIFHISDFVHQKDIPELLNSYRYAIMPTRLDAQGVMMCEMAVYGIPMIISDLPVCHEMLDYYSNCVFVKNLEFHKIKLTHDYIPKPKAVAQFPLVKIFNSAQLAREELNIFIGTE
ncbi:glycosyltransferase [Paralysiella testudinis]|uniref:Glycosyltransferase family 4 protein n=1 Tax=Paralysiella testudinis TaxID=2809020 RepID=A0A892ZNM5_9NEIS|nr:glycosyltransferase [Paralysiella testudinis]QRQ82439.1 glycosyltransferase family 4 protein [Paralysiella testudinis]